MNPADAVKTSECVHPVAASALALLEQCDELLNRVDDHAYVQPCDLIGGSTIGQHMRHTLDHYAAISVANAAEPIDYDHRVRGGDVETNRNAARACIENIASFVRTLEPENMDNDVSIRIMVSSDGELTDARSTLVRELAFATHHAIHHNAMIASIARTANLNLSPDFGKAPSTVNYESACKS